MLVADGALGALAAEGVVGLLAEAEAVARQVAVGDVLAALAGAGEAAPGGGAVAAKLFLLLKYRIYLYYGGISLIITECLLMLSQAAEQDMTVKIVYATINYTVPSTIYSIEQGQ